MIDSHADKKLERTKSEKPHADASKTTKIKMCGFEIGSKIVDSIMI